MPPEATTVPRAPEEITSDWLSAALGVPATRFRTQPVGAGQGFAGRLVRLSVDVEGGSPLSLIAKFPAGEGPTRDLAERFGLYERELCFYQALSKRAGAPVPRLYYGASVGPGQVVLLLEDLSGMRQGDLIAGCSLEEAAAVAVALARMHALWWDDAELDELWWLPAPDSEEALALGEEISAPAWEAFLKKAGRHLPRSLIALGDKLNGDPALLKRLGSPPRTLVHGDVSAGNVLFKGGPAEVGAILDWQTVLRGRGPIDIAHFFVTSLTPRDRRIAERDILPQYHAALVAGGVTGYSYKDCWDDYRMAVMNQFGQIVALSYLIDIRGQINEQHDAATGLRPLAALTELDVSDLVPAPTLLERLVSRVRRPLLGRI